MAVYSNGQYRQYCSMGSNGGVYMIWSAAEARQLYLPQDFKSVGLQNYTGLCTSNKIKNTEITKQNIFQAAGGREQGGLAAATG